MQTFATTLVDRTRRRAALAVAALLVVLVVVTLPFAPAPLARVDAFLPIYLTLAVVADAMTAYLLLVQFRASHFVPLAALAAAYLASATIAIAQFAAFPGVFAPAGVLGAGSQTAVWLWAFWHAAFPLLVAVYAFVNRRWPVCLSDEQSTGTTRLAVLCGVGIGGLAAVIAWYAPLPTLVIKGSYAVGFRIGVWEVVLAAIVGALAYTTAVTRGRTLLDLWLIVALVASLGDAILTLSAGHRFSLGWYLARIYAVLTATGVLGVFFAELISVYERVSRLVMVDGLTGLENRRSLDERLGPAIRAAVRAQRPLAVAMIDVDDFKRYNDAYGHLAGDDALRAVAGAIRAAAARPVDIAARYGGEEFVLVLPDTTAAGLRVVAERVRAAVEALAIPNVAASSAQVITVSIGGTARLPGPADSDLIRVADSALYAAKAAGRNRVLVVGADDPGPSQDPAELGRLSGRSAAL